MKESLASIVVSANDTLFGDKNLDAVTRFFTPDYVVHVTGRDLSGGHAVIRTVLGELFHAFPDLQADIEILLAGDDRVTWLRTLRGTHREKFKGFPPSQHTMQWRDMVTSVFRDGMIFEEWVVTDLAEQLLLMRKR